MVPTPFNSKKITTKSARHLSQRLPAFAAVSLALGAIQPAHSSFRCEVGSFSLTYPYINKNIINYLLLILFLNIAHFTPKTSAALEFTGFKAGVKLGGQYYFPPKIGPKHNISFQTNPNRLTSLPLSHFLTFRKH